MKNSLIFIFVILVLALGVGCKKSGDTSSASPTPPQKTESAAVIDTYDPKGIVISCTVPPYEEFKDNSCIQISIKKEFLGKVVEGLRTSCEEDEPKGIYRQAPCDTTKLEFYKEKTMIEEGHSFKLQFYLSKADIAALESEESESNEDRQSSGKNLAGELLEDSEQRPYSVKEKLESIRENFRIEFQ